MVTDRNQTEATGRRSGPGHWLRVAALLAAAQGLALPAAATSPTAPLAPATPAGTAGCGLALHAHRGAPGHPENSLSAVRAATQGAWEGVEIDVQLLRDGTPVLHHDLLLGRTTSLRGKRAADLDGTAWREVRLKRSDGALTREAPPFLTEVLEALKGTPLALNAEIKQPYAGCAAAERTVRALHEGRPDGQWFISAIERGHLQCARRFDPAGYLGLVVLDAQSAALRDSRVRQPLRVPQPRIDEAWINQLLRDVKPPLGLHLDAHTLEANPALLELARSKGIAVMTYSLRDDKHHTQALRSISRRAGLLPSGAIIDGSPDAFCEALKR